MHTSRENGAGDSYGGTGDVDEEHLNKSANGTLMTDVTQVNTFEGLLELVGTWGRWNISVFVMCAFVSFLSPMNTLSYQFLGATPDHWCHVGTLVNANWTQEQILSLAIPFSNETKKYEGCLMYDYNYEMAVELGYEGSINNRSALAKGKNDGVSVNCKARDFNHSQYESTVVTEWDLVCDRLVLYSTTQAIVQAGKLIGYLVFGYVIDRYGRRPVVILSSLAIIASSFLAAASPTVGIYILLKWIINTMDAGLYLGCFVFVMELCSSGQRSMVGSLFVIPWALGYMAVPGIAYLVRPWKQLQAALSVPLLYSVLFIWFLPESPRWLVLQGRHQEALEILKRAAKVNRKAFPQDKCIFEAMERINAKESAETSEEDLISRIKNIVIHFFILLIKPSLRLRTLVVFFCWFSVSMVYYGVALNATNLSTDPYLYIFLGGLLEVPSYVLLWPAIVYFGRRKTLVGLFLIAAFVIFAVLILMLTNPEEAIATVFFSQCGKFAVTAAFHLIWMFTAELFPTSYRSIAVGEASMCARIGSTCSPYINDLLGRVAVWAPSAVFGSVSFVAAGLSVMLPETRGRNLPDSENFFQEERPADASVDAVKDGTTNAAYASENNCANSKSE